MPSALVLAALSALGSGLGAMGGLGGAIFLVPALVLAGLEPAEAAPLGMISVAAASLGAAPTHLERGLVHHRLGILLETVASSGAVGGALLSAELPSVALTLLLAAVAVTAGVASARPRPTRNLPRPEFVAERVGEWPGSLGGVYRMDGQPVPYHAVKVPAGLAMMSLAGLVSGLAGVSGGFIKTPTMSELMRVPVKVAAATTTFTVGITAAAALLVYAGQGRIDTEGAAAVVLGGLAGGMLGERVQHLATPDAVRRVLALALIAVGVVLVVTA